MNKQLSIEQFTKNLFWDISPLAFDVEQCPAQIVERVLERGEWSDWCLIRDYFGLEQIAAICKTLRTMSPEFDLIDSTNDIAIYHFLLFQVHQQNILFYQYNFYLLLQVRYHNPHKLFSLTLNVLP